MNKLREKRRIGMEVPEGRAFCYTCGTFIPDNFVVLHGDKGLCATCYQSLVWRKVGA